MNKFNTVKKQVQIDDIMPNPWNPNVQDKGTFAKEIASIKELGMLGSILVRDYFGKYQILDGEHRWKAAKELGYTDMTIESIGEISDQKAKFLTIHLNNLRGKDDVFKRAAILQELDQGQLELLPWSSEEIENEKQLITFDFSQYDKQGDLPPRTPGMLVVLPLNDEETQVWLKAKELLVARNSIGTDNTKKKQDIQALMYLIKATLDVHLGANDQTVSHTFEKITPPEALVQLP